MEYDFKPIEIVDFKPLPDVKYAHDYLGIFEQIAEFNNTNATQEEKFIFEAKRWRYLICNDLWFILYFVLKIPRVNHPFVINYCWEVETGPKDKTLDICAREHFKTSIITIAETIKFLLKNPEHCTGIFCYVRDRAEKFLFSIKEALTTNEILLKFFPDVLYNNPEREAPIWSIEKGIVVKRKCTRPEPTVGAYGLIEGMPTSIHLERRIYDDIITDDICENYEMIEKVKKKYDMSQSLGKEDGIHRVVGTYYAYDDPLIYIRNKKHIYDREKPIYHLRFKPVTDDGTPNGKPVFLSEEYHDFLKTLKTYNSQYLLNPSPTETKKLDKDCLLITKPQDMPERLFKFLLVDPSGKKGTGDPVAILLIGVNPDKDDNGASNIYILNAIIEKFPLPEFILEVVKMYKHGGKILRICVEEVGQSTTEVHIKEKLNAMGYFVSTENDTIQIFKPSKRSKTARIEELSVPLINGKIHISSAVPQKYIDIIKSEMENFPFSNDDHAIDTLSYFIIDTLPDYPFPKVYTNIQIAKPIPMGAFI